MARNLDITVYYRYNTLSQEQEMFENPVAKRTAVAAVIGGLVAIPLPFIGPLVGALLGGGVGYFTAPQR